MVQSMTGFARVESETTQGQFSVEIRSVNQRFLDLNLRLPEALRQLENRFRKMLSQSIKRGKLEIYLNYVPSIANAEPQLNQKYLQQLVRLYRNVQETMPEVQPFSMHEITQWPGVLEENVIDSDALLQTFEHVFAQALQQLIEGRQKEGTILADLILQRAKECQSELSKLDTITDQIKQKLMNRVKEKARECQVQMDQNRFEQELVFLLQKADVSEEIDRLHTHLAEVSKILNKGGLVGRRLDFLMQELNREANTLASKSVLLESTNVSVELKVLIEQMREQIQNLE